MARNIVQTPRRSPMKRLLMALTAIVALSVGLLHAQDVVGIWQGTLHLPARDQAPARDVRAQIRVVNEGGLKATLQMIDQGPGQLPATVSVQGSAVKLGIPG